MALEVYLSCDIQWQKMIAFGLYRPLYVYLVTRKYQKFYLACQDRLGTGHGQNLCYDNHTKLFYKNDAVIVLKKNKLDINSFTFRSIGEQNSPIKV